MTFSAHKWHRRYQQQARWTKSIRNYLYDRIKIQHVKHVLDVGCGTGVLLEELSHYPACTTFGVDINHNLISLAHETAPSSGLTLADALSLPYRACSFDIALCHFVLLWVKNPLKVLKEMVRVVQHGGYVLALAEPDYGGRIDFPIEVAEIGRWQTESLKQQGANPFIGRELRSLLSSAGLMNIEVGVLGGQWGGVQSMEDINLEWEVISSDLSHNNGFLQSEEILKSRYIASHMENLSITYVPTFYAIGEVKG
jgi:SAM-dependent methyltransferase